MPEIKRVTIGQISRIRGLKGEMVVIPWTNNPDRFLKLKEITVSKGAHIHRLQVAGVRRLKRTVLLKSREIQTPEEAKELVGGFIEIDAEHLIRLPHGNYFVFEIVGLEVRNTKGEKIGEVKEVISLPANDIYVVRGEKRDFDIPAIREIIKKIDLKNKVMIIEPIAGLLEL